MATSPTSGTCRMVLTPLPKMAATMCLVTAFFDPRMKTSPRRGPEGVTDQARVLMADKATHLPARAPHEPAPSAVTRVDDRSSAHAYPRVMAAPPPRRRNDGILSDPIDLDGPRNPRTQYPSVPARAGLVVKQRGTPITGVVVGVVNGYLHVKDRQGFEHRMTMLKGGFEVDGAIVTLVEPRGAAPGTPAAAPQRTASGSVAVPNAPAQVAKASRILVEGLHDAELVEKVWGDDLRVEGVVVEQLEGADHLDQVVRSFAPKPGRRLGILLDHLVDGSKETRIAASVAHPHVLVRGHPYVDIWQAVKPSVLGISAWPEVPRGEPWKEGVMRRLGVEGETWQFWKHLLGKVTTWTDLEPPLIGAVEELIDFVTEPAGA